MRRARRIYARSSGVIWRAWRFTFNSEATRRAVCEMPIGLAALTVAYPGGDVSASRLLPKRSSGAPVIAGRCVWCLSACHPARDADFAGGAVETSTAYLSIDGRATPIHALYMRVVYHRS
jgi:hypothetical protein